MLIYVILHKLCLVNEQNAMINLKNDMVKNTQKPDEKQIPAILALKKSGRYNEYHNKYSNTKIQQFKKANIYSYSIHFSPFYFLWKSFSFNY